jgi:hypothetical protein
MRLQPVVWALGAAMALLAQACSSVPARTTPPVPDTALEADVCAVTKTFSELLAQDSPQRPEPVRLARAHEWYELASAYDLAKAELERCIDPKLEATFQQGTEVWPSRPPISATKKFSRNKTSSFTDEGSPLTRIELETVNTPDGAELRLRVR